MTPVIRNRLVVAAVISGAAAAISAQAATVTLGFDEIPNPLNQRITLPSVLPTAYAGFTWTGFDLQTYGYYNTDRQNSLSVGTIKANSQHLVSTVAGPSVVPVLQSSTPFYLQELTLTGVLITDSVQTSTADRVRITGRDAAGQLIPGLAYDAILVTYANGVETPLPLTVFSLGWTTAVSQLWFEPQIRDLPTKPNEFDPGGAFLLDNIQLTPVPVPPAAVLLLGSLAGLGLFRRQKRA